jgi:hypothetical protein
LCLVVVHLQKPSTRFMHSCRTVVLTTLLIATQVELRWQKRTGGVGHYVRESSEMCSVHLGGNEKPGATCQAKQHCRVEHIQPCLVSALLHVSILCSRFVPASRIILSLLDVRQHSVTCFRDGCVEERNENQHRPSTQFRHTQGRKAFAINIPLPSGSRQHITSF